jgi:hypothetical protein
MVTVCLVVAAFAGSAWAGTQFSSVNVNNLVTLVSSYDTSKDSMDFIRLNKDGTAETKFFRVKSGNFLVVTDVEFLITGGTPEQFVTLDLLIVKLSNLSKYTVPFSKSLRLDAGGNGSANVTLNAGFVIDTNARPGAQISAPGLIQSNVQIILHGYISS